MRIFLTHWVEPNVSVILTQMVQGSACITTSFLKLLFNCTTVMTLHVLFLPIPEFRSKCQQVAILPFQMDNGLQILWLGNPSLAWGSIWVAWVIAPLWGKGKHIFSVSEILKQMMGPWSCSKGWSSSLIFVLLCSGKTELNKWRDYFSQQSSEVHVATVLQYTDTWCPAS